MDLRLSHALLFPAALGGMVDDGGRDDGLCTVSTPGSRAGGAAGLGFAMVALGLFIRRRR